MNRRYLLKNMFFVSAGVALIPACIGDKNKSSFLLKNITVTGDEENMLASLTATILPTTDTPGAKELSSHLFVMMMVDDCYNKEGQQKFSKGMAAFEALTQKRYSNGFTKLTDEQKKALLTDLGTKAKLAKKDKKDAPADPGTAKDISDEVNDFYSAVKRLTVQSFTSSQYFLTKVQVYELVPGRYHGCVPVKAA